MYHTEVAFNYSGQPIQETFASSDAIFVRSGNLAVSLTAQESLKYHLSGPSGLMMSARQRRSPSVGASREWGGGAPFANPDL